MIHSTYYKVYHLNYLNIFYFYQSIKNIYIFKILY